jgi:hypothetical protein
MGYFDPERKRIKGKKAWKSERLITPKYRGRHA